MADTKRKAKQKANEFSQQLENVYLAGLGAFANAQKMGTETFDALILDYCEKSKMSPDFPRLGELQFIPASHQLEMSALALMDSAKLLDAIDFYEATVMQATPATWHGLLDAGFSNREGFQVLCGGEALPPDLAERLANVADLLNISFAANWQCIEKRKQRCSRQNNKAKSAVQHKHF